LSAALAELSPFARIDEPVMTASARPISATERRETTQPAGWTRQRTGSTLAGLQFQMHACHGTKGIA